MMRVDLRVFRDGGAWYFTYSSPDWCAHIASAAVSHAELGEKITPLLQPPDPLRDGERYTIAAGVTKVDVDTLCQAVLEILALRVKTTEALVEPVERSVAIALNGTVAEIMPLPVEVSPI